jgi:hypothetical protein
MPNFLQNSAFYIGIANLLCFTQATISSQTHKSSLLPMHKWPLYFLKTL